MSAFLALVTIVSYGNIEWHDQQRLVQVLALALMLSGIAIFPDTLVNAAQLLRIPVVLLTLFLAWGIASAALATHALWAWLEWSLVASIGLLLLVLSEAIYRTPQIAAKAAAWGICIFILLFSLKSLAALAAFYTNPIELDSMSLLEGFSNRRILSQSLVLAWPLLVSFSLSTATAYERRLLQLAAVLTVYLLMIAQARGAFFGLLLSVGSLLVVARLDATWWRHLICTALLGVLLYAILIAVPAAWFGWDGVERHLGDVGLSGRGVMWAAAIDCIREHVWFGIGPIGFAALNIESGAHPHNMPLQIAAEWGLPAATLAIFSLLWGLCRFASSIRACSPTSVHYILGIGLFMSLSASLFQSLVDGVFVMPVSQMFLASVAAASMAWCRLVAPQELQDNVKLASLRVARALSMTLLFSLGGAFWFANTQLFDSENKARECSLHTPRFWACGAITSQMPR